MKRGENIKNSGENVKKILEFHVELCVVISTASFDPSPLKIVVVTTCACIYMSRPGIDDEDCVIT